MNNLDFKLNREAIAAAGIIVDTSCEQSVERDFILPDYYPDIFRILKCTVSPSVTSHSINGGKLSFETAVLIRVMYLSENDKRINAIEQKLNLSKTLDLNGECLNPSVWVLPQCDYINCRVVNQRRLDVRGAITSAVKVIGEVRQTIVTDAFGCGIELKKQLFTYPAKRINAAKRITVIEELELAASKPAVGAVLRCGCTVTQGEKKVIAGKLITKGEAEVSLLYSCIDSSGEDSAQTMKFSLPFSQIIDVEGIDESFDADVDIAVGSCEIIPKGEDGTKLECELVLLVCCTALKYETGQVVADAYSTSCECEIKRCEAQVDCPPTTLSESCQTECALTCQEGEISCVYDGFAECRSFSARADEEGGFFVVSGTVLFSAIGCGSDKMPFYLETEIPFEQQIPFPQDCPKQAQLHCEPRVSVAGCSYYLADTNRIEMKAQIKIGGMIRACVSGNLISELRALTDKPKTREASYALKLCRCSNEEDIWDIAKKYSTSVRAIMEENELDDDKITQQGMLLIPLIS